MGKLRMLAISLIGTGLFASCSASSDSADLVELTTTSTIATTTIAQPSSSTTEASTTTSQAQTTTSEATPTTTLEELTAEIEADLQAGRDLVTALAGKVDGVDVGQLAMWHTEPILEDLNRLLEENRQAGVVWQEGPTRTNTILVESVFATEATAATVIFCLSNDVLVRTSGSSETINDDPVSIRYTGLVRQLDGVWKLADAEALATYGGFGCGG